MASVLDRRSWDDGAGSEAEQNFQNASTQLKQLIEQRNQDVTRAMADYMATGVSAEYQQKEARWKLAADNTKSIVDQLQKSLNESGQIAASTSQQAAQAVANIG